jgi:hypothetical protein
MPQAADSSSAEKPQPTFERLIKGSSTIHYTQLPDPAPDDVLYHEYNTYRRELPRWLAEGREGQFALIKGQTVLGLFATFEEARDEGMRRYLFEPFLAQQILELQPVLRVPWAR